MRVHLNTSREHFLKMFFGDGLATPLLFYRICRKCWICLTDGLVWSNRIKFIWWTNGRKGAKVQNVLKTKKGNRLETNLLLSFTVEENKYNNQCGLCHCLRNQFRSQLKWSPASLYRCCFFLPASSSVSFSARAPLIYDPRNNRLFLRLRRVSFSLFSIDVTRTKRVKFPTWLIREPEPAYLVTRRKSIARAKKEKKKHI